MSKTVVLASALFLGAAAFGLSAEPGLAASAKRAHALKTAECEPKATLQLYTGEQRSRWVRQCVAGKGRSPGKTMAFRPTRPTAMPRVTPLGSGMGSTAPSNAPVAPSTPVVGSSGTSISGADATAHRGA